MTGQDMREAPGVCGIVLDLTWVYAYVQLHAARPLRRTHFMYSIPPKKQKQKEAKEIFYQKDKKHSPRNLVISFKCGSCPVTSLPQALHDVPLALPMICKLFSCPAKVLGTAYLNTSHHFLPYFLLLTPLPPHWYFSPLKHQVHFDRGPWHLLFTPHGTLFSQIPPRPSPTHHSDLSSNVMSSERPLLTSLTKAAASFHHHLFLAHYPTYLLQFYSQHLSLSKIILLV